ncbi:MAG: hypothetical protein EPGJADBJ_04480 [Saprospiraceae bacterium]|nr:hypothetical protein [Saprospiraceae bacterium]
MSGFKYLIDLQVLNGSAFGKLAAGAGQFESALESAQGEVGDTNRAVKKLGDDGRRSFDGMAGSVRSWLTGLAIGAATLGSLNAAVDTSSLETAIVFAGGKDGAANLAFVEQSVTDLNTTIESALSGFRTLEGSMMGTNVTAQQTRDIYQSVAVASRVMGLSADNTTGALLALGQMASKGKVQAEELRGQLGERIPGAFAIAARAMGVSNSQLDKMLERGEVMAEEFLPKFAAEMMKTFGPGLESAINGPRAQMDKFHNSVFRLKNEVGMGLMPVATALINNALVPLFNLIGNNIPLVFGLAGAVAALTYRTQLQAAWTVITTAGTWSFTGAMTALNAAMMANPVGFIIAGFMALAGAVTWAWQKSEGFRGFLFGMWETIKTFAGLLIDRFVKPVIGAFQVLRGAWNGSTEQIQQGMSTLNESANAWSKDFGSEMGNAFDRGWNNGVADFRGGQSATDTAANLGGAAAPFGGANFNANTPANNNTAGSQAKQMADNITGGGQRNVTIHVGKMTGVETLHTVNMKEGTERIGQELIKILSQVLNSANQMQTANG